MEDLKQHCEKTLISSITTENVCDMVLLGDMYSAKHLREQAIRAIQRNPIQVTKSEGWARIVNGHPTLVTEIVRSFDKCLSSAIGPEKTGINLPRSESPQL